MARPPAAVIAQASWSGWLASSRCVCGSSQLPSASSCPACDRPAVWTGFRVYEEADASPTTYRRSPFIGLVAGEERTVPARAFGCAVSDANTPGVSISRTDSTMVLESLHEDIDVSPEGSTSGAVVELPWPSTVRMRRARRAPLVLAAVGEQ